MDTEHNQESKKRILYIGTPIFGYYKHILKELEELGYSVDFYNDRPSENSFIKGLIKVKKNMIEPLIDKYFNKILDETKNKSYDFVLIINCKVFSTEMVKLLRKSQPSAKFVLYMWDSLTLYPNVKELLPAFDETYSFDLEDCENVKELRFLPLFYTKIYGELGKESSNYSNRKYDITSICTAHPNRYEILRKIVPYLKDRGINVFSYMFINKLQYIYNKTFVEEFKGAKSSEFKYKTLSEQEIISILKDTKAVFDIQHSKQSGLTMRTIETLGSKRKLITYNKDIKKYDFYTEDNVLILNDNNWDTIPEFIKREYVPLAEEIYNKYSLRSWIETMIGRE